MGFKVDKGLKLGLQIHAITSTETYPPSPGAPAEPSRDLGLRERKEPREGMYRKTTIEL